MFRRSVGIPTASLLVLVVLALPGISATGSATAVPVVVAHPPVPVPTAGLPAVLSDPWSERAGYISGIPVGPSSATPATGPVTVAVTLWPRNLSLFAPRSSDSPALTDAEFEQEYSPPVAEYQSVIQYFEGFGLSILHTWPDRLSVTVQGPAPRIAQAFGTTLLRATAHGAPVLYPSTVPSLPPSLQSEVSAVSGLSAGFSSFSLPVEPVAAGASPSGHLTTDLGSTTSEVTPSGAHGAYDVDPLYNLSGTFHSAVGQNIVLLLWGDGYAPSDLTTFFSTYYPSEYPAVPTVKPYPIDGAPLPSESATSDPSGGPQELTLDLEWSGSMAPGATLDAVYAPDGPAPSYSPNDTPMEDALSYAVNTLSGVSVISMSFGLAETSDPSFQMAYTTLFAEAVAKGITLVGASGDDGGSVLSHGNCSPTPEIEFPASSPDVLAVGGTAPVLNVSLSGVITGIATQPAWNRSGGGLSQEYAAPAWQLVGSAKSVIGTGGRGVPDVAGPSADNMIYYNGHVGQLAGTSFSTPMWGGIIAEIDAIRGSTLGLVTPRLYALAASEETSGGSHAFADVSAGGNCLHSAQAGWNEVTGWGTPRVFVLYAALTSTFVDLSLSPNPTSVFPGGTTTISVSVRNGTTDQPVAGVPVNVSFGSSTGYTGPCGGSFGSASAVTNSAGNAQVRFSVPVCYFGGQAQVSAVLLSQGYFGQASATVTVSLLSGTGFLSLISSFPYNVIFFGVVIVLAVLIGAFLSRRGRRRPAVSYPPPLGAQTSPAAPPSWVAQPPPPTTAMARPPVPSTASSTTPTVGPRPSATAGPRPTPAEGFAGVPSPPAAAPSARPSTTAGPPAAPAPTAVTCPSCGTLIPAYRLSCPKCGLARP